MKYVWRRGFARRDGAKPRPHTRYALRPAPNEMT